MKDSTSWISDIGLRDVGELMCLEALKQMKGLSSIQERYNGEKPLTGVNILGTGVVSYEYANFIILLHELGANIRCVTDSLHYTVDAAAAYISANGIPTFAFRGMTEAEMSEAYHMSMFRDGLGKIVAPDYIISDGAQMPVFMLEHYPELLRDVKSVLEQTASGLNIYSSQFLNKKGLNFPVINVNDSLTKAKFDNIYGSRESLIEGIQSSLNIQIAGEKVVVFGYGEVGKGCVQAMSGLGAHVGIVEIDPIMAMQAHMDGYEVFSKEEALKVAKFIITATGCQYTISAGDIALLGEDAVLMNMSEGHLEIDVDYLNSGVASEVKDIGENCKCYTLNSGKNIYVLCDGYVVNLYAGNGHPPTVMGATYTTHIMALIDIIANPELYKENKIHRLRRLVDEEIACMCFPEVCKRLHTLDKAQSEYVGIAPKGPFKNIAYKM